MEQRTEQAVAKRYAKMRRIQQKPIRHCLTMHECYACGNRITLGQDYHDGGYGSRAHVICLKDLSVQDWIEKSLSFPFILAGLIVSSIAFLLSVSLASAFDISSLSVQLGPPRTIRGPFADELDTTFNAVRLSNGQFRGFSANGATYALTGETPTDMSGQREKVLDKGAPGSIAECGRWLNNVIPRPDGLLLGFVHTEQYCGRSARKAMALAVSKDEGLTWRMIGRFMVGTDTFTPGRVTGEGDCGVVDGGDGYYYAYCLRQTDWRTIVARAPVAKPYPGRWRKWYENAWSQRGQKGQATALGNLGTSVARWIDQDAIVLLAVDPYFGGVKLSISTDKTSFVTYSVPLLPLEGNPWIRPSASELIAYPSMLNPVDGSNQVHNTFDLCYTYVPAYQDYDQRHLVCRSMKLEMLLE